MPSHKILILMGLLAPACLTACTSVDWQMPWERAARPGEQAQLLQAPPAAGNWAQSTLRPYQTPALKPPKSRYFSVKGHGPVVAMTFEIGRAHV